ncbi:hypothetical protein C8R44DRAFT_887396 [Mycena epipterygia]|nr:hypothetical protein C8R44DRAFT_887396 [Mycena epipterygia]
MLLDLSVELLQEIGGHLARPEQKSLRQICKSVSIAVEPQFFSSLVLEKEELRIDMGRGFLEALATGETGWSRYSQTLHIKSATNRRRKGAGLSRSEAAMKDLLASVLGSLSNVQTVVWVSLDSDFAWEVNAICDFLNTVPLLNDLRLEVYRSTELPLPRLSGLRRLNIRTSTGKDLPFVQHIPSIVAQNRNLTSLHLSGASGDASIWTMLRARPDLQIHLKDISTGSVTPDLLAYLASYSGVEKLTFWGLSSNSQQAADDLADTFFTTVLPRHTQSLLALSCTTVYESRWSFGAHNVDAVSELQKLRNLEISINTDEPINAVDLLIRTADLLHDLQLLEVDSAKSESSRNVRRGCVISSDDTPVDTAIQKVLQTFRSPVASPTILRCGFMGCHVYVRKAVESEESTSTAEGGGMWAYRLSHHRSLLDCLM